MGDRAKDVLMTSKLESQPGMVTTWNLGAVRNFLRQQKMMNPETAGELNEDELARVTQPSLQLSKTHPGMFLEQKNTYKSANIFENNSLPIKRIFPRKKFFPKETEVK